MPDIILPFANSQLQAGFKTGSNGPHVSRTLMLDEIARCLDLVPPEAIRSAYKSAIVERNILGKRTEATRRESFRRLRELYSLDPATPLFEIFRSLDTGDPTARPLLALLIASARDPLLRATIPVILASHEGEPIGAEHFNEALEQAFPRHLKEKTRAATARHIASTWTQSGHLTGRTAKKRARVSPHPSVVAFALLLGTLQEVRGPELFTTVWCRILDLNADQARTLAAQAHREGLLDLHAIGSIVEIAFPRFQNILMRAEPATLTPALSQREREGKQLVFIDVTKP